MLKKYFLSFVEEPTLSFPLGILIGWLLMNGLGFWEIEATLGNFILVIVIFFGPIPLLVLFFWLLRHRFVATVKSYATFTTHPDALLRVVDGRVVEYGKALWGKENVFPVAMSLYGYPDKLWGYTTLSRRSRGKRPALEIRLTGNMNPGPVPKTGLPGGFSPQHIYDVVVRRGYNSLGKYMAAKFKRTALASPAANTAFRKYANDPLRLASAVVKALRQVDFPWDLDRIGSVEVEVRASSHKFTFRK